MSPDINAFVIIDSPAGSTCGGKIERHQFEFDHVFGKETNQENVFEEISQLVQLCFILIQFSTLNLNHLDSHDLQCIL